MHGETIKHGIVGYLDNHYISLYIVFFMITNKNKFKKIIRCYFKWGFTR